MALVALTPDLSDVARKSELLAEYRLESGKPDATADDMFDAVMERGHKIKDIGARLVTNSSGVWSKTYPAGFWKSEPVMQVTAAMPLGNGVYIPILGKSLSGDVWTLSVTFYKINPSITIAVLGTQPVVATAPQVWFDLMVCESV